MNTITAIEVALDTLSALQPPDVFDSVIDLLDKIMDSRGFSSQSIQAIRVSAKAAKLIVDFLC